MNWQEIEISIDRKSFTHNNKLLFKREFLSVLEFQSPGIASVQDQNGWYHIDTSGFPLYNLIFDRAFGFYFDRAAVVKNNSYYHIGLDGSAAYEQRYSWCGNFQENLCIVKDFENHYFHINPKGESIYSEKYIYAGDFKEGIACVCLESGKYTHIDTKGNFLHSQEYELLDVYHKGFARAKDKDGWFHINRYGFAIYKSRYSALEPFYNGQAFAVTLNGNQVTINESGDECVLRR